MMNNNHTNAPAAAAAAPPNVGTPPPGNGGPTKVTPPAMMCPPSLPPITKNDYGWENMRFNSPEEAAAFAKAYYAGQNPVKPPYVLRTTAPVDYSNKAYDQHFCDHDHEEMMKQRRLAGRMHSKHPPASKMLAPIKIPKRQQGTAEVLTEKDLKKIDEKVNHGMAKPMAASDLTRSLCFAKKAKQATVYDLKFVPIIMVSVVLEMSPFDFLSTTAQPFVLIYEKILKENNYKCPKLGPMCAFHKKALAGVYNMLLEHWNGSGKENNGERNNSAKRFEFRTEWMAKLDTSKPIPETLQLVKLPVLPDIKEFYRTLDFARRVLSKFLHGMEDSDCVDRRVDALLLIEEKFSHQTDEKEFNEDVEEWFKDQMDKKRKLDGQHSIPLSLDEMDMDRLSSEDKGPYEAEDDAVQFSQEESEFVGEIEGQAEEHDGENTTEAKESTEPPAATEVKEATEQLNPTTSN